MKMYMTIEEVAQSLRVTVPTVRWLRQEGRFAPAVKVGRRVLWDEEALMTWLEANREAPAR
jgi:excisionase family DNA binding protein